MQRWSSIVPMLAAGGVSIVAGGVVAAVTGPTDWDHGSWVAAFLVLVAGVAQLGVGAGQAQLVPVAPTVSCSSRAHRSASHSRGRATEAEVLSARSRAQRD